MGCGIYLGVLIGWWWPAALAFCITWLNRCSCYAEFILASLLAAVVAPLAFYLGTQPMGTTSMVFWSSIVSTKS
jgi:glycerol-3-phosphate acyltransferase PlsY